MPRAVSCLATLAALALGAPCSARAADSVRLTDVIKSNGRGDIDLLTDVTAAALEWLRVENGGALVLAIDVNEAASGTEKANSQAVTIDTLVLRAVVGGVEQSFTVFETQTQALLARAGETTRSPYFTCVGESGSNRITGSNSIQDSFDATIRVAVPIDLSAATSVVIEIVLLDVNLSLGDPEQFYDYSNGFEDLALVNSADATFLDDAGFGREEAPAVVLTYPPPEGSGAVAGWIGFPDSVSYYTVGYEDLFPNLGDYDFNDLMVSYRVDFGVDEVGDVVVVRGSAFIVARGAGYSHDWHLGIDLPATASGTVTVTTSDPVTLVKTHDVGTVSGVLDIEAFADTRSLLPPPAGYAFTNTEPGSPFLASPRVDFSVTFDAPVAQAQVAAAPFDPYLRVRNTDYEVHLPGRTASSESRNTAEGLVEFLDPRGYPFAFLVPTDWQFPWERTDLGLAYPDLVTFARSGGKSALGWYQSPVAARVRAYGRSDWEWHD